MTINVTNVNEAPTGLVTISGTVKQGQVLTASNTLADVDGGGIVGAVAYQWYADNVAINGATSSNYTLGQAQVGKAIKVMASYTDGSTFSNTKESAASVLVANDLPVISQLANFATVAATLGLTGASDGSTAIYGIEAHDVQNTSLDFTLGGSVNVSGKTISDYLELRAGNNNSATVYLGRGVTMQSLINALGGLGSSFAINVKDGNDTVPFSVLIDDASKGGNIIITQNNTPPVVTTGNADLIDTTSGGVVYQPKATDADGAGVLKYALSGPDAGFFDIDPLTGGVTVRAGLDGAFLNRSDYAVNLEVTDSVLGLPKTTSKPIVINRPEVDTAATSNGNVTVVATQSDKITNNTTAVVDVTQTPVAASDVASGISMPFGKSQITADKDLGQGTVPTFITLYVDKDSGVNGFWTTINGALVNLATDAFGGQISETVDGKFKIDLAINDQLYQTDFVNDVTGAVTINGAAANVNLTSLSANPMQINDLFWS